jgi:methyl-accepting chemotaxis protein
LELQLGFIAQEVNRTLPAHLRETIVQHIKDGYLGLRYSTVVVLLTGAVQHQAELTSVQASDIEALKELNSAQAEQISAQAEQISAQAEQISAQAEQISAQADLNTSQAIDIAALKDSVAALMVARN